ncbi:MAG: hypothetical protein NC350_02020 [Corallococcus sp.]|nr:hypothetical protein [Corallococcus sp.]
MKKDYVTIIDFGSSKITAMVASRINGGEFLIKAVGQCAYNGFDENGWYEPETIEETVRTAIEQVESKLGFTVKEITVGVPGNFCYVATGEATTVFRSKKKVDAFDLDDILSKADIYGEEYGRLIGKNAIYYLLDGAIKTYSPIGVIAQRLTGLVCFSYVNKYFCKSVETALGNLGISKINYVNTCEMQTAYVSRAYAVNGYAIVIDVGHITTNVMLSGGKSLLFAKTFALGSGYIASDLCQVLGIEYDTAMSLLGKINLKLEFQNGDCYRVGNCTCEAQKTNEIVKARIEQFAEYIKKCFNYCDKEIPRETPIILTGGGLTYICGASEWLSYYLAKPIKVFISVNPQTRRNEYTSCYGLLQHAIDTSTENAGLFSFFKKKRGAKINNGNLQSRYGKCRSNYGNRCRWRRWQCC